MNLYYNVMHDIFTIIFYEFIQTMFPLWQSLFLIILNILILKFKKYVYTPKQISLNLQKVLVIYNNEIILYNLINLNYYNINIIINNKKINITGNDKYVIINYSLFKINKCSIFKIYLLPLKIYIQEECCICYTNQGTLVGVCGHQNICSDCIIKLNKCPICNNNVLFTNINSQITNFINST